MGTDMSENMEAIMKAAGVGGAAFASGFFTPQAAAYRLSAGLVKHPCALPDGETTGVRLRVRE
jgi:hypothetical protein